MLQPVINLLHTVTKYSNMKNTKTNHMNFLQKIQTRSGKFKEEEEGEEENYYWGERDGGTFLFSTNE